MERLLQAVGFQTLLHFDSEMNAEDKNQIVKQFQVSKEDELVILLASIETLEEHTDLATACHMYLMESCMEPVVKQAVIAFTMLDKKRL